MTETIPIKKEIDDEITIFRYNKTPIVTIINKTGKMLLTTDGIRSEENRLAINTIIIKKGVISKDWDYVNTKVCVKFHDGLLI